MYVSPFERIFFSPSPRRGQSAAQMCGLLILLFQFLFFVPPPTVQLFLCVFSLFQIIMIDIIIVYYHVPISNQTKPKKKLSSFEKKMNIPRNLFLVLLFSSRRLEKGEKKKMIHNTDDYLAEHSALLITYSADPSKTPHHQKTALRAVAAMALALTTNVSCWEDDPDAEPSTATSSGSSPDNTKKPFLVTLLATGTWQTQNTERDEEGEKKKSNPECASSSSSSDAVRREALVLRIQPANVMVEVKGCVEALVAAQQQQQLRVKRASEDKKESVSAQPVTETATAAGADGAEVCFDGVGWVLMNDAWLSNEGAVVVEGLTLQRVGAKKRERAE